MRLQFFLGSLIIVLLHVPIFIFGENSIIFGHDNVDFDLAQKHILKLTNQFFSFNLNYETDLIFNGFKTSYIHSTFNFSNIFYILLPTFWAYVINGLVVRLIGFTGAYLLLRNHLKIDNENFIFLVAILFSLIPVYTIYGISVLGIPLLYMSFLKLSKGEHLPMCFLTIIFFVIYSHFYLAGVFIIIYFFCLFFTKKHRNKYFFYGIITLVGSYIILNFPLIYHIVFGEVSQRAEFMSEKSSFNFIYFFKETIRVILYGEDNSGRFFLLPIILWFLLAKASIKKIPELILIIIISFITVFYRQVFSFLNFYDFSRIIFLFPFFTLIIIAKIYILNPKSWRIGKPLLILSLIITYVSNLEISSNVSRIFSVDHNKYYAEDFINDKIENDIFPFKELSNIGIFGTDGKINKNMKYGEVKFDEFFSKNIFLKIKQELTNSSITLAIGFHPSILHLNEVKTLNSYQTFYPLKYKNEYRKIIKPELEKNKELRKYFDNWGNRVYAFSHELYNTCKSQCYKNSEDIKNLNYDINQLKIMEVTNIISTVKILNYEELDLNFVKTFIDDESLFNFYLYKLN